MPHTPLHAARRLHCDETHGHATWTSPAGETREIASISDTLDAVAGLERGFDADIVGLALHALILTLRTRRGYPLDFARGAVIQAAETLRGVIPPPHAPILDQALAIADGALLNGDDDVPALVAFTADAIARLDRAAERCGRRATALIDENDRLLIIGDGAALRWMVQTAAVPRTTLRIAGEATICVVADAFAAMNGDVAGVHPEAVDVIALARARGVPVYALAPNGPTAAALTGARIPAHLLNAIVTDRGVYRPERIATYQHLST